MRGGHALTLVLFASGCTQLFGLESPVFVDAHPGDGGADGVTANDASTCFGSGTFAVCLQTLPVQPVSFTSGATLATTNNNGMCTSGPPEWTGIGQPDTCFIIGTTITIGDLRVIGSRPIVFLASNSIMVTGLLDAGGHGPSGSGPGGPSVSNCPAFVVFPAASTNGGGGGAGASFMTLAGNGGTGNNGLSAAGLAVAANAFAPAGLRAGCQGQTGAAGGTGGVGGPAGGAVYLVAGSTISLGPSAMINASGGGAGSSGAKSGGGGGGSGGMIVLYAPSIQAQVGATVVANGGGGSAGGANSTGAMGTDPDPKSPLVPAPGVTGAGGAGGSGFAQGSPAATGGNGASIAGGGGGGGGGGYIRSNVALTNVVASPTPSIVP